MNAGHDSDKILDHTRQQLSALVDGELAPDEAAFLMRRLQHDPELAGCWERWQLVGAVLRGHGGVRVADGFSARVMDAIAHEPTLVAKSPRRWLHWTGGALAASVALVALLMSRPAGPPHDSARGISALAQTQVPAPTRATVPATPVTPAPKAPATPDTAAQLASAVAVAEVPRRMANGRRGSGQAQRAAMRAHDRATAAVTAVAAPEEVAAVAPAGNPFSTHHALPASRPWPRALVTGVPAGGAFTVDYGGNTAPAPSFFPFEPARLQPQRVEPQPLDNP
jgi:negative regulator of sigma E activity